MGCRLVWEEVDLLVLRKAATGLVNIAWRSARYEFTDTSKSALSGTSIRRLRYLDIAS
jgi:hypothetical protein